MQTRRQFLAFSAAAMMPGVLDAHQVNLPEKFNPVRVRVPYKGWLPGELHVIPDDFFLYFMLNDKTAIRYGVGVGRKGLYQPGVFSVARKAKWPWWRPTDGMIRREPEKYAQFKDGLKGGRDNPLGARALYLYDDQGRDTHLRIHGTNAPSTIGSAVSNGCARLTNENIMDLYERVDIGARVFLYPKVNTE